MKRSVLLMLLAGMAIGPLSHAQQANQNVNVLPVYYNDGENVPPYVDENGDPQSPIAPDAYLKGDLYLQRQVEPTIVESTRNPDHLLAFFVDYRAVDIPDDIGLGQSEDVAEKQGFFRTFIAKLFGRSNAETELPAQAAAAEAWVGGGESYDGGATWSGFMVPGMFEDASPASVASPIYGLEAATDPVAAPAPCGAAYVGLIGFTRGGESKMVVARYRDLNNLEGGATWVFDGMSEVESGNNAEHGHFIDKPFILVDPDRLGVGNECAHNVYVTYSTFNGLAKDGKFQSKVNFAQLFEDGSSLEGPYNGPTFNGQEFDTQTIHKTFKQNQGTWMAVDPRPGTPSSGGGGTVYVFWRHFFDPDAILMRSTSNFGQNFIPNPKVITGDLSIATFDQLGISTASGPGFLSFRSNGFPTAAVSTWDDEFGDKQATVMVAFQERVDDVGFPSVGGSPRIMLLTSQDEGDTWTDAFNNSPEQRLAVDIGERDLYGPPPGFGALPVHRPAAGPQVMPAINCGAGRCMLTYYESRGLLNFNQFSGAWEIDSSPAAIEIVPNSANAGFISDIRRLMDLRAAKLDPVSGALDPDSPNPSIQVSRYTIRADADLGPPLYEDASDVMLASERPCFPYDIPPGFDPLDPSTQIYPECDGEPALNRINKPQSGSGSTPFVGDYNFVIPIQRMVPNGSGTGWEWLIDEQAGQYDAFRAIWTDNRNLIAPTEPSGDAEYLRYPNYGPPGIGGACANVGSRNTDVLTALIEADLILQAPTTYKQLDVNHTFPLSLMNASGEDRYYRLTITPPGDEFASFALQTDIDDGDVHIFPYSSISQLVYVDSLATGQIRVEVRELYGPEDPLPGELDPDGAAGFITFNADGTNPVVGNLGDTETMDSLVSAPEVTNPFALNPFALNPFALNSSPSNPFALNPFALNPFALNTNVEDVIDTTWTINAGESDTASSYVALPNIDNIEAFLENYTFQLLIYRTSSVGSGDPGACTSYTIPQDQLISNISQDPNAENPFALNPFALNPFALNPFALNPFALNSAFTMAPDDSGGELLPLGPSAPAFDDGTTRGPRPSTAVQVTLRAIQRNPLNCDTDYCFNPWEDPPSLVIRPLACDLVGDDWVWDELEGFYYYDDGSIRIKCRPSSRGPDLVPELEPGEFDPNLPVDANGVVELAAGQAITFPYSGWTLFNQGNASGTAETTVLRTGYYLSQDDVVDLEFDEETGTFVLGGGDLFLGSQTLEQQINSIPPQVGESVDGVSLNLPDGLVGPWNLILYVDDLMEVSESDEFNNFELAQFSVNIVEPNSAPVAVADSYSTDEDTPLSVPVGIGVLFNDTDVDVDDVLSAVLVDDVSNGTLALSADGSFTYTPNTDFNGSDSFTYLADDGELPSEEEATVTITVNPVNDVPEATAQSLNVSEDGTLSVLLTGSDLDGDSLTFAVVEPPTNGVLTGAAPNLTYTPEANYNGPDSFTFVANDGTVDSAPATVSISVDASNDAPVANAQSVSVQEDLSLDIVLTGSDVDGDELTYTVVTGPARGALTGTAPNLTYSPTLNLNGPDAFTFKVNDGKLDSPEATIDITVNPVNDPPVIADDNASTNEDTPVTIDVLANDNDSDDQGSLNIGSVTVTSAPESGTAIVVAGGDILYTPDANFNGPDEFQYQACDTGDPLPALCGSATVSITVTSVNDPPTAPTSQTFQVPEDTDLVDQIEASDVDPDTILSFSLISGPSDGELDLQSTGSFTYSPDENFDGTDSFTVEVCDDATPPLCVTDEIVVTISVQSRNDAPVANAQSVSVQEDLSLDIVLTGSDVDGDELTYTVVTGPARGALTGTAPNLTYSPTLNLNGPDAFTFKVNDGKLDSPEATIDITVNPVNDPPVIADDNASTSEDTPVTIDVLANDNDSDDQGSLNIGSVTVTSAPASGTTTVVAGGGVFYTPDANFNGSDSFQYQACDLGDPVPPLCGSATVLITVTPVNDPPVPFPDAYTVNENSSINFDPKTNDGDVDGTFAIVQVGDVSDPSSDLGDGWIKTVYGRVKLEADNTVTYWPDQNYEGPDADVIPYVIQDDHFPPALSESEITITVDGFPPDWLHIGLLDPWKQPSPQPYTIKRGSAFPVRWQYADPASGLVLESSGAMPEVRLRGPLPTCDVDSQTSNTPEEILTPGNSDYQYDDKQDIHQLNVDTNNLDTNKCYNVYTYSGYTLQLDGPFIFKLKK